MPERPPNRYERSRTLSDAHAEGQLVKFRCSMCHGIGSARFYRPSDLMRLLGDVPVVTLRRAMTCEGCGYKDYLQIEALTLSASDRQAVKVRHLVEVKLRKVPVWRDD